MARLTPAKIFVQAIIIPCLFLASKILGVTIINQFKTLGPNTHCGSGTVITSGRISSMELCAAVCLQYQECTFFEWLEADSKCDIIKPGECPLESSTGSEVYQKKETAAPLRIKEEQSVAPIGMARFDGNVVYFETGGTGNTMSTMDWQVCSFSCLIDVECAAVTWTRENHAQPYTCYFKPKASSLLSSNEKYGFHKIRNYECIEELSRCYVAFSYVAEGVLALRDTAGTTCQTVGGHLANIGSDQELTLLKESSILAMTYPLWVGMKRTDGKWVWEEDNTEAIGITWTGRKIS